MMTFNHIGREIRKLALRFAVTNEDLARYQELQKKTRSPEEQDEMDDLHDKILQERPHEALDALLKIHEDLQRYSSIEKTFEGLLDKVEALYKSDTIIGDNPEYRTAKQEVLKEYGILKESLKAWQEKIQELERALPAALP